MNKLTILDILSVAGGGGSDSGYSGGGWDSDYSSSSSSGSSRASVEELWFLGSLGVGYVFFLAAASLAKRIEPKFAGGASGKLASAAATFILSLVSAVCALLLSFHDVMEWIGAGVIALMTWLGWFMSSKARTSLSGILASRRMAHIDKKVQAIDPSFNSAGVLEQARELFHRFQDEWSQGDASNFASYMTPRFAERNTLLLRALGDLGRINEVQEPTVNTKLEHVDSLPNTSGMRITVRMSAHATDVLKEKSSGTLLYTHKLAFTEYWTLNQNGNSLLLEGIHQQTADWSREEEELRALADQHAMHFSIDMGWLLLPKRGRLFGSGAFGVSDINNHVIGVWSNILVQLYTYQPHSDQQKKTSVVGQISLPKSYGGIIVQPRRPAIARALGVNKAPRGYTRYTFEWDDFNNRYEVYATDPDRLATFELINPKFMADLYDADKDVSIEVVDNVVYLHKNSTPHKGTSQLYQHMLHILQSAYKELHR